MKKILLAFAALSFLYATPASAMHSGLYSPATPKCVPAIVALYWYNPAYAVVFKRIHDRRAQRADDKMAETHTPACWMGVASKALGIKHRYIYRPRESIAIRTWFRKHTGTVVTGSVTGTSATNQVSD